jgi:predicted TIM-barrel fold metal-dependent hydrolase
MWESSTKAGLRLSTARHQPPLPRDANRELLAGPNRLLAAAEHVDRSIVLGFKSRYLGVDLSNDYLAAKVADHPDRLIGFAGIDPSRPREATEDIHRAKNELGLRGVAVAPAAQDFHPTSSQAMQVYAVTAQARLPIIFHVGVELTVETKLEFAQPLLLDEVAREFPDLRIVVSHMGFPWISETNMLLAKHEHVFAEISWMLHQPWQAYQALLSAYHAGVIDKLLFGSGFPYLPPDFAIESLYSINQMIHGTHLPTIPREALRGIVERDTLALLGLEPPMATVGVADHADAMHEDRELDEV